MRVTLDASRVSFKEIDKKTVNYIYKDKYVKEQYRNDFAEYCQYNKNDKYDGIYIDGDLAGTFNRVEISPIEVEVHMAFYKEYTVYSRYICKEYIKWLFEENNIYRITTYVMDFRRKAVNMALKIGFKYEGFMQKCIIRDGVWYGKHVLGIVRG